MCSGCGAGCRQVSLIRDKTSRSSKRKSARRGKPGSCTPKPLLACSPAANTLARASPFPLYYGPLPVQAPIMIRSRVRTQQLLLLGWGLARAGLTAVGTARCYAAPFVNATRAEHQTWITLA